MGACACVYACLHGMCSSLCAFPTYVSTSQFFFVIGDAECNRLDHCRFPRSTTMLLRRDEHHEEQRLRGA